MGKGKKAGQVALRLKQSLLEDTVQVVLKEYLDTNGELITAYRAVKDNVKEVIRVLQTYETEYKKYPPYSKEQQEYYFQLRNARNNIKSRSDVEIAVLLIALNKTCFNGLYRVNRKGEFNVPPGKYKNPLIYDSSNLQNVSNALAGATILADDYRIVKQNAQKDDFIYLDPSYQPLNNTSYFTAYISNGFGSEDQVQLAKVYRKLADKGCRVLLSNSDTPFIRRPVDVQRAINCKGSKRTGHKELIISNYF